MARSTNCSMAASKRPSFSGSSFRVMVVASWSYATGEATFYGAGFSARSGRADVPDQCGAVRGRGDECVAVRPDGHGAHRAVVPLEGLMELPARGIPGADRLVPAAGD